MVSKSVLFALTIVALATGGASLVTGSNFNSCVGAAQQINVHLGLGLNLGPLISKILNCALNLVANVLSLVGKLLGSVLGLLGGSKVVTGPTDLNSGLAYVHLCIYISDCGFQKLIGQQYYSKYYMSQIFIYCVITALGNSGISTDGWDWLDLDSDFDLVTYCNNLKACKQYASGSGLLGLFDGVFFLVDTILDLVENLTSDLLGEIISLFYGIFIGYSKSCGYTYYNNCYTTVTTTYTPILTSNNCGTINQSYLVRGNYCSSCIAAAA